MSESYPSTGLGFTAEDVQRAAAHVCAQSLSRLDHPSGTGDFLQDQAIASARAAGLSTTWSVLQAEDFTAVTRRLHLLILDAADHTSLATLGTGPRRPGGAPESLDFLLPPDVGRWATGGDIRHAAITLAHDLIADDLSDGPIFGGILDEPIASRFTLDGSAPTWGQLPAHHLIPALWMIHQAVEQAHHDIDAAVDQAIHNASLQSRPATTAPANTRAASAQPPAGPAAAAKDFPATPNRADQYGTDVEIWYEHRVFADVRTGISPTAHQILWEHGFTLDHARPGPDSRVLARDDDWSEDKACATRAAQALTRAGFTTNVDPILLSRDALAADHTHHLRRQQAATRTSPTAGIRSPGAAAPSLPLPPTTSTAIRRTR
ncbi:hypothetical protein [Actinacidiphila sp. bgisy144]|uniref:hypothetical protein n=1 Tax=Actinacidiphila sp. bgisy144 TaxID=3413791 RepID=UPI003EB75321